MLYPSTRLPINIFFELLVDYTDIASIGSKYNVLADVTSTIEALRLEKNE